MTTEFKDVLVVLGEANECYQPETLEELRKHFHTIQRALLIADKIMQEPSESMLKCSYDGTASAKSSDLYSLRRGLFNSMRDQMLREIE